MHDSRQLWERVAGDEALTGAAEACDPRDVTAVARLRKRWNADEVRTALALAEARRRADGRIEPPAGHRLMADPEGAQMATATDVARHKAARFALAARADTTLPVLDLCCGIGGDAIALQRALDDADPGGSVGAEPLLAVDHDPARAWMASVNAGCRSACEDVEGMDLHGRLVHLDPQRRDGAKRRVRYADLVPGPEFVERVAGEAAGAAVKLPPGIDPQDLPPGEVEFISRRGRMNQAVLWAGVLADEGGRRATAVDSAGRAHTLAGTPDDVRGGPEIVDLGRFVYAVDPAVERARLLAAFGEGVGMGMVHEALGLFSGDDGPAAQLAGDRAALSPFLTPFEVVGRMPWRVGRVRAWLAERGAGVVEVKTRGRAVDPDGAQRELRGRGDARFTVFVLRFGTRVEAIVSRRV